MKSKTFRHLLIEKSLEHYRNKTHEESNLILKGHWRNQIKKFAHKLKFD